MLSQFWQFVTNESLLEKKTKTLLAVSGGLDSVVMCWLFHKAKLSFGIAHCNFKLRGQESDKDELFVKSLAKKYNVSFFSKEFSTDTFSKTKGISVQMAARELRYNWFEKIRRKNGYDLIAVAHHKDDSIETFFINLIRGTGISGLHGILPRQNWIIRPLLFATKKEIEVFSKKNKLAYREDRSNMSDKYLRNKIRLKIIPELKKINESIGETIANNISRIEEVEKIYLDAVNKKWVEISKTDEEKTQIAIGKLKELNPINTYLFEFLKPYRFNISSVKSIVKSLDSTSGKEFYSPTHRLIKDRTHLILTELNERKKPIQLTFKTIDKKKFKLSDDKNIACLDLDLLKLPLKIRKWEKGDFFYPLGMRQKKKLSDFLIDNKNSLSDKEKVHVLTSGSDIVWVIGMRIDERFKITHKTSKIYACKLIQE